VTIAWNKYPLPLLWRSTDAKPTVGIPDGAIGYEQDTGLTYRFVGGQWSLLEPYQSPGQSLTRFELLALRELRGIRAMLAQVAQAPANFEPIPELDGQS
jgi:hypothetical protein